jgi:hypothetical protein
MSHELRVAISSEVGGLVSDFCGEADGEARRRTKEATNPLARNWSESSALDKYYLRVKRAAAQYRRECVSLSPVTWREYEARAYAELQAEQQRAMRELVTGEHWRLVAVRNAPHQEPAR